jgi:4-diphosphocytidyl-2-C-methyl-D-erythritol kinase
VLRALNRLAPRRLRTEDLLRLAGPLGADVPFLTLEDSLALAWGRGERLMALPPLPARDVTLACFDFGISSADAFGWVAAARAREPRPVEPGRIALTLLESWEGVATLAGNDFGSEVARRHEVIADVLVAARGRRPLIADLSGSGSTVFVIPYDGGAAFSALPTGVRTIETRTASSVEDVEVIR